MSNDLRENLYLDVDALMEKCRVYDVQAEGVEITTSDTESEEDVDEMVLNMGTEDTTSIDIFKYEMYKMCIERVMSADSTALAEMTQQVPSFADRIAINTLKEVGILKEIE